MSEKDKPAGAGFFGTKKLLKKYKEDTPGESVEEVYRNSGLGKWFHSQSAGGKPGWDRYNTKGERVGECGDSKPGEGKPKCLSKQKAAKLRSQGGKNAIANAVKRKKAQDPQQDRPGTGNKPINVSNRIKKEDRDMKSAKEFLNDMIMEQLNEDVLNEKNVPTDPGKWSKAKAQARAKFDVYPSAYANAWAAKKYKAMGGSWTTKESAEEVGPEIAEELIDLDLSEAKKKRITKLHGKYPKGTHYCATHVEHAEFGHGNPIHSQHAAPDEFGDIDWYDVMFEHGIEQRVPTDDLEIHLGEAHYDHVEHDHPGEDLGEGPAHQNPLVTAYGGMKAAKDTPSYKAYFKRLEKERAERAAKAAKTTKEEVELDELKKSTLQSYKDKAKKSERSGRDTGFEGETPSEREAGVRQVKKRVKGIDRATKKLVAGQYEDVEQVDELKMPQKDSAGRIKSGKVRDAFRKGSEKAFQKSLKHDNTAHSKLMKGADAMNKAIAKDDARGVDAANRTVGSAEKHMEKGRKAMIRSRKREVKAESVEVIEAKVGDTVHLGHATKGGTGVRGKVVKIDGNKVHIKNDKGAMFKGPMDRVSVEEAIKYDSAGDSTGTVTGKGKRDRGPGGKVTVKYKGSDTYRDGAKLPIGARDMGRLIKTARKKGTTPYDSRNLKNPRLTKDHVEHEVDEGMMDKAKKAAKMLGKPVPRDVHNPGRPTKKSAGDVEAERREKERLRLSRRESVEVDENYEARKVMRKIGVQGVITPKGEIKVPMRDRKRLDAELKKNNIKNYKMSTESYDKLTPKQERDAERRLKPTRATVNKVRLRATDDEVADKVKKYQSDKAGKPGNTKARLKRDLRMKLRGPK